MRLLHAAQRLWAVILLLCLLTVALALGSIRLAALSDRSPAYLLKDDGGYLAVYTPDGITQVKKYDILTRMLPEGDFAALQAGVPAYSDAQLERLIEDYGG